MTILRIFPTLLSFLLLAAHYLRQGAYLLTALCLLTPFLLLIRQRLILRAVQFLLLLACTEWFLAAYDLLRQRTLLHEPFLRAILILGSVGLFAFLAALFLQSRQIKARYPIGEPLSKTPAPPVRTPPPT